MFIMNIDNQCCFIFFSLKTLLNFFPCTTPGVTIFIVVNLGGLKRCSSFTDTSSPACLFLYIDYLGQSNRFLFAKTINLSKDFFFHINMIIHFMLAFIEYVCQIMSQKLADE